MHTLVGRLGWTVNRDIEVSQVVVMGNSVNTWDSRYNLISRNPILVFVDWYYNSRLSHQPLGLLDNALRQGHDCKAYRSRVGIVIKKWRRGLQIRNLFQQLKRARKIKVRDRG